MYSAGRSAWTPIIDPHDPLADHAWEAVMAIATSIVDLSEGHYRHQHRNPYEEALLYGYLALGTGDQSWFERAADSLNCAIDAATYFRGNLRLFGGLCGLGWTIEHLTAIIDAAPDDVEVGGDQALTAEASDNEDLNSEIDNAVLEELQSDSWHGRPYDLIGGLVGIGIYLLERLPSRSAVIGLKLILNHLERIGENTIDGLTWHSDSSLLPEWQRRRHPNGYYNLGVAHGIPGILFFLDQLVRVGLEVERSSAMLTESTKWLLAQKCATPAGLAFSSWITRTGETATSRLAWCYGDLGIVAVLRQIARSSTRSDYRQLTDDLVDRCVNSPTDVAILDAPLCHGAAGNAHIFNRLYHFDSEPKCHEAAMRWLEKTLSLRRQEGGIGGFFKMGRPGPSGAPTWETSPSFLDGAIGVGLALLAALTPVEPQWDRLLLLSGLSAARLSPLSGQGSQIPTAHRANR